MSWVHKPPYIYLQIGSEWFRYPSNAAPIGSGAMGAVYIGQDCKTGQRVAIKLVHREYAEIPAIRQRAHQEAALRFMHRNLIEMIGLCEEQPGHGAIWIVSKFVQGITIDRFFGNLPTPLHTAQKACELFYPVLDALSYLHSRNILHLDIKPTNIMVENSSNVRLMDLGIAMDSHGSVLGSMGILGTPNYAAPEQFDRTGVIDARSDIYQTSVTLYELITGLNPYATNDMQLTIQKHKLQLLRTDPKLPAPVYEVLAKAASPDRYSRYATAAELKAALQQALAPQPSTSWWKSLFGK